MGIEKFADTSDVLVTRRCLHCNKEKTENEYYAWRDVDVRPNGKVRKIRTRHVCKSCQEIQRKEKVNDKSTLKYIMEVRFSDWKNGAKSRNIPWNITPAELANLFVLQKGVCDLTDLPLYVNPNEVGYDTEQVISLDRIRSDKSYVIENVRFVAGFLNLCKRTADFAKMEKFKSMDESIRHRQEINEYIYSLFSDERYNTPDGRKKRHRPVKETADPTKFLECVK